MASLNGCRRRRAKSRLASLLTGALVVVASHGAVFASSDPAYHPPQPPIVLPQEPVPALRPPVIRPSPGHPLTGPDGQALTMLPGESRAAVAGRTPVEFAVTSTGASSYTIPLWTPPGIGALELALALRYNSRSPGGVLGVGWSLDGLSAISRCNRSWAQDGTPSGVTNSASDRFCLDGRQLKLAGGVYGAAGSTYATEIESFSRIEASGALGAGPESFTVTGKNGLIYEYGTTLDARIHAGASGPVRTWALSAIRDRAGGASGTSNNRIELEYANEAQPGNYGNGSFRIAQIRYPITATGQGPYYTVEFTYSARPAADVLVGYLAGQLVREPNRLDAITVRAADSTELKSYHFVYTQGAATQRLSLATVQECVGTDCLAPTTIQYQDGARGWPQNASDVGVTASNAALGLIPIDLDGDARSDLVYPVSAGSGQSRLWATLSTGTAFGAARDTGVTLADNAKVLLAPFAGVGAQQLLVPQGATWSVLRYADGAFTTTATNVPVAGEFATLDYDGDGLPDLAATDGTAVTIRRNTTTAPANVAFAAAAELIWSAAEVLDQDMTIGSSRTSFADYDGDGRADLTLRVLLYDEQGGRETVIYVLYSHGFGAPAEPVQLTPEQPLRPLPADWNGDGCTDLIVQAQVYLSQCSTQFQVLNLPGPGTGNATLAADWDGDGRVDLLFAKGAENAWYVQRSTGAGYAAEENLDVFAPDASAWFVFDADGDGLADLGFRAGNDGNKLKYRRHQGAGIAHDLATSFTDGFGMQQRPSYVSIAERNHDRYTDAPFPRIDFAGPLYVVDQFLASTGTGSEYQQQFWYYGATLHRQGRGFEGFYNQRTYDSRNGLVAYDFFERAFPYSGMHTRRRVFQDNASDLMHDWQASVAVQTHGTAGIEQRYFPYIAAELDQRHELGGVHNGTLLTETATEYTYADGYGNATRVAVTVTDRDPNSPLGTERWTSITDASYRNDSSINWCLGLPERVTTTRSAPGAATTTRTAENSVDAAHCRISAQRLEPDTPALALTTTLEFDDCGNVESVTIQGANADGTALAPRVTRADHGARCQWPASITDAAGQLTGYTYDARFGAPLTHTDPNGLITGWQYDAFGRRVREDRPDGTATSWGYESCTAGPCFGVEDLRFKVDETPYDSAGVAQLQRWTMYDGFDRVRYHSSQRVLGPWTNHALIQYDSLGRRLVQYLPYSDATNGYTQWSYDALDRVSAIERHRADGALNARTAIAYAGRTHSVTDALARTHTRIVDVLGQLRRVIDPSPGGTTRYDYDGYGNLTRLEDAIGAVSSATFNARGFQTGWQDTSRGNWTFEGNSLNELTAWSDAAGQRTTQAYDALGRMLTRTAPDGASTWSWGRSAAAHNVHRLERVEGLGYAEDLSYDSVGRLSRRQITTDQSYAFDYTYNAIGALDTLTYPASPIPSAQSAERVAIRTDYSFMEPYRLVDVTGGAAQTLWTLTAANDASLATAESLGAGIATRSAGYRPWTNELTALAAGASASPGAAQDLSYDWDAVGNLTERQDHRQGLTETFTPDALDRLSAASLNASPTSSMTYDAAGNVTSKDGVTHEYSDPAHPHQLTRAGSELLAYDANGNVASRNGLAQEWATSGLPTRLRRGEAIAEFAYGPEQQRWRQVASDSQGSETTHYVGGVLETVQSSVDNQTHWRHYVPTPSGLTILITRREGEAQQLRYLLKDHLGSSDAILDAAGQTLGTLSFDAWGGRRGSDWSSSTPPDSAVIEATSRRGFTSHEALDGVGLVHMNGRVYDPLLARFLSTDPILGNPLDSQAQHPFAYVGNRPLSYTDPTGLEGCAIACPIIFAAIKTIMNFAMAAPGPPPAAALPGFSAQNGVSLCSAGAASSGCSGMILSASVAPSAEQAAYREMAAVGVELIIDFIPVVGSVKGAYDAYIVFRDPNASNLDRAVAIIGVLPGGKGVGRAVWIYRAVEGGGQGARAARNVEKAAEAARATSALPSGVTKIKNAKGEVFKEVHTPPSRPHAGMPEHTHPNYRNVLPDGSIRTGVSRRGVPVSRRDIIDANRPGAQRTGVPE